jgi:hypothetical protein
MWTSEGNTQVLIPVRELAAWIESSRLDGVETSCWNWTQRRSTNRMKRWKEFLYAALR